MVRDALICRKGRYGWRWCVVPLEDVPGFEEHDWIRVLTTDDMAETVSEAIEQVRESESRSWTPIRGMRFRERRRPHQGNGE
jgi:hypothetical protein